MVENQLLQKLILKFNFYSFFLIYTLILFEVLNCFINNQILNYIMKKVNMFSFMFGLFIVSAFLFSGCNNSNKELDDGIIVGNDSDEHGCKASAGYVWNEEKQECVRSWEENNTQIANPASEFCVNNGGKLEIKNSSQGDYGICNFRIFTHQTIVSI